MSSLYILELLSPQGETSYYVGTTNDIERRVKEHLCGMGAEWTRNKTLVKVMCHDNPRSLGFDPENSTTKELMLKYGIDKVRGGSYCSVNLSENDRTTLQKELWSSQNLCYRCGRNSHFVADCYATTDVNGNKLVPNLTVKSRCSRCGRDNHSSDQCYARTDDNGKKIYSGHSGES
jgi:predicted GIY-YIG superfamily endonuclease